MLLKQFYYKLPNSFKSIILKLSSHFYNNLEYDFVFNPEIGKKYDLTINDKKNILKVNETDLIPKHHVNIFLKYYTLQPSQITSRQRQLKNLFADFSLI